MIEVSDSGSVIKIGVRIIFVQLFSRYMAIRMSFDREICMCMYVCMYVCVCAPARTRLCKCLCAPVTLKFRKLYYSFIALSVCWWLIYYSTPRI